MTKQIQTIAFEFEHSKAMYKRNGTWQNLTLLCNVEKTGSNYDILLTHNGEYISWELVALLNYELTKEIKEAARQHYKGLDESVEAPDLEMNLLD